MRAIWAHTPKSKPYIDNGVATATLSSLLREDKTYMSCPNCKTGIRSLKHGESGTCGCGCRMVRYNGVVKYVSA